MRVISWVVQKRYHWRYGSAATAEILLLSQLLPPALLLFAFRYVEINRYTDKLGSIGSECPMWALSHDAPMSK